MIPLDSIQPKGLVLQFGAQPDEIYFSKSTHHLQEPAATPKIKKLKIWQTIVHSYRAPSVITRS